MKCILSHTDNPFFNLAAEEYLLKKSDDEYYFQYVNRPSVVVGKHQNAVAEVDEPYLSANDIWLARRISGGGAVYHDQGNMNYSFITNEAPGDYIKFKKYTAPVIGALKAMGVEARLGSRNEILSGEKKISGTASHVFKTRVLHHGTLLFDTDLAQLSKCLYVDAARFKGKAVKSIRSEVVNIKELLEDRIESQEFFQAVFEFIAGSRDDNDRVEFSQHDLDAISELVRHKFSGWDWNYGYSPKYEIERTIHGEEDIVQFSLRVNKGIIDHLVIHSDAVSGLDRVCRLLIGSRHEKEAIIRTLEEDGVDPAIREVILTGIF